MSDIPKAREYLRNALFTLKGTIEGDMVTRALTLMRRDVPNRLTRAKSRKMGVALARQIRIHHRNNPDQSNQEIAETFGVNAGRVSEAVNKKKWNP